MKHRNGAWCKIAASTGILLIAAAPTLAQTTVFTPTQTINFALGGAGGATTVNMPFIPNPNNNVRDGSGTFASQVTQSTSKLQLFNPALGNLVNIYITFQDEIAASATAQNLLSTDGGGEAYFNLDSLLRVDGGPSFGLYQNAGVGSSFPFANYPGNPRVPGNGSLTLGSDGEYYLHKSVRTYYGTPYVTAFTASGSLTEVTLFNDLQADRVAPFMHSDTGPGSPFPNSVYSSLYLTAGNLNVRNIQALVRYEYQPFAVAAPEPGTLALLGAAGLPFAGVLIRRRRQSA